MKTPTPEQADAAKAILHDELKLLRDKVKNGATLRVGERRYLERIVIEAEQMQYYCKGGLRALEELQDKGLCHKCAAKLLQVQAEVSELADSL
jgi:hypothetical protein